jgi:hypothetical protein
MEVGWGLGAQGWLVPSLPPSPSAAAALGAGRVRRILFKRKPARGGRALGGALPARPAGAPRPHRRAGGRARGSGCGSGGRPAPGRARTRLTFPEAARWRPPRRTRGGHVRERGAGCARTSVCGKLCARKYICCSEAYLERCFLRNKRVSKCSPEYRICGESTHTRKGLLILNTKR